MGVDARPNTGELHLSCNDDDYVCQLYKRYIEEREREIEAAAETDPLAVLAMMVMRRHGINPVCSPAAKRLARKYIEYHKALKKLEYYAKRYLDHPLLAREARYEAEMATSIVAAIGYFCYEQLNPEKSRLDAEIMDAMVRARAFFTKCDDIQDYNERMQCIYNRASWAASGSSRPDLIASYLRELDTLIKRAGGRRAAAGAHQAKRR